MSTFNLNNVALTGVIDDVSTAGQIYIPVPDEFAGDVVQVVATLDGAIITADATLTVKDSDGNSLGTLTVAFTGSAAGTTFKGNLSPNQPVRAGTAIEVETDGGSTNAVKCYVTVVVKR